VCSLFGADHVKDVEPMMAGEDFAFFLQKIPGAMIFLGHYTDELKNGAALHNPHFMLHEGILARGAAYHAALATSFLQQGGFPTSQCSAQGKH
jgi:IAA-amino acid hydrolase